ncbi:hypothetical protein [Burkholderia pseudomallei]|uniref:hypothetical protein n=1 Tax=Burkholderia pseudomallei TaxID=28450 RepID=UPI001605138A|nr:hypothetical protein [Burkholderia pseudomallei]
MPIASGAPFHPCGIGAIAAPAVTVLNEYERPFRPASRLTRPGPAPRRACRRARRAAERRAARRRALRRRAAADAAAPFHYSRIEAAAVRRAAATTESHGDGANPPGIAAARY